MHIGAKSIWRIICHKLGSYFVTGQDSTIIFEKVSHENILEKLAGDAGSACFGS